MRGPKPVAAELTEFNTTVNVLLPSNPGSVELGRATCSDIERVIDKGWRYSLTWQKALRSEPRGFAM